MNQTYYMESYQQQQVQSNYISKTTYSNTSLQTDPDLYALKNKKRNEADNKTQLVSNNRLAYVEALVGNTLKAQSV